MPVRGNNIKEICICLEIFEFSGENHKRTENDRLRGWKVVQKSLPRIIHYGQREGILQKTNSVCYIYFEKLEISF